MLMDSMNLIIDPGMFVPFIRNGNAGQQAKDALKNNLANLATIIASANARVAYIGDAWQSLYSDHIDAAISQCGDHGVRAAVSLLRRNFRPLDSTGAVIRAWGALALTQNAGSRQQFWASSLADSAVSLLAQGESVAIFTGLDVGRNCVIHQNGHSTVLEKTRWALYFVSVGLNGAVRVPCVSSMRNLSVPWTARFDEALPDAHIAGGFRFVPPNNWVRRASVSLRAVKGRMAWIDIGGNGWVPPNTPGVAYHWDVHFADAADSPNRLNPCNIVKWGAPAEEGIPGGIHHVPAGKRARAR